LVALYPRLWRFCLFLTRNPDRAADLAQGTCERALRHDTGFTAGTHLDRWLFTLARRTWLNDLRAQNLRTRHARDTETLAGIGQTQPSAEQNYFAAEVLSKAAALPEAQRTLVFLVYVEGNTHSEAAAMLDIPIGTVMGRLAAARRQITAPLHKADQTQ
jgi:RNA polymerase sigma-70 factor (ECF subfamily)